MPFHGNNLRRVVGGGAMLALTLSIASCGSGATVTSNGFTDSGVSTEDFSVFGGRTQKPVYIPRQLIIKYKSGVKADAASTIKGAKTLGSLDLDTTYRLIEIPTTTSTQAAIHELSNKPDVDAVQQNMELSLQAEPNDPMFKDQWYLGKVKAASAWEGTQGDGKLIVAIVDTGVDYNHPDLKANMVKGQDFTNETPGDPIDGFGHGTHVAGIVAAVTNNGAGVAGAAPKVKLMPVKVLTSKGSGSLFTIAAGIKYAVDNGAKIVNLSLGGPAVKDVVSAAIGWYATRKKGALLVAAAGNSAGPVGTPARIHDYYMAVAATNADDTLAKFSNFGPELSVSAPGVQILNTTPTYDCPLNKYGYSKNYAALQGTSMATPLVAGVAALVWSRNPGMTYEQVRAKIEKTAVKVGPTNKFGHGRVDADAAVLN